MQSQRRRGRAEGEADVLRELLTLKFGPLPVDVAQRLHSATEPELQRWTARVLGADSLLAIFD